MLFVDSHKVTDHSQFVMLMHVDADSAHALLLLQISVSSLSVGQIILFHVETK